MATRIRLRRVGRSKQASFRIVVAGSMHARSGRITENIGKYNPRTQPSYIEVDEARALFWLRQGAEVSESVRPLFRKAGILRKFAEGAEGTGVVTIGDPQGKTNPVRSAPPVAAPAKEAVAEAPAKAEPEAKAEKPKEAKAEPEAKAEKPTEAKAEPKAEKPTEAKAEPEAKAEADDAKAGAGADQEKGEES